MIFLSTQVREISNKLETVSTENNSLLTDNRLLQSELSVLKLKTKNYLSFISWDTTEFNSETQENSIIELENELRKAHSVNASNSATINSLIVFLLIK